MDVGEHIVKQHSLKFSLYQRILMYGGGGILLLTGVTWVLLRRFGGMEGGESWGRSIQPWLMKVHGFAAVFFVFLLGTLVPSHIRRALGSEKNLRNGYGFMAVMGMQVLSGYSLYYVGDESMRAAFETFHVWVGMALPVLVGIHIWRGRRAVAAAEASGDGEGE